MTAKKDLKRRVRERQQQTGESYVAARRGLLAESAEPEPPSEKPFDVVEMEDVTALAAELGFKCTVAVTKNLSAQLTARTALERLRDVLLGTTEDPALEPMRAVVFRNAPMPRVELSADWYEGMKRFMARVKVGIGGVNEAGTMLAMPVVSRDGVGMVTAQLGWGIVREHGPRLVLTLDGSEGFHYDFIASRRLR
jgi:hypothetical protein